MDASLPTVQLLPARMYSICHGDIGPLGSGILGNTHLLPLTPEPLVPGLSPMNSGALMEAGQVKLGIENLVDADIFLSSQL